MAMPVDDPAATAVIEWIRPEAGGNRTGPPGWPVAVEIVFPWEEMRHYRPEHIDMNWGTTVIIDPVDLITAYVWESKLDFIARRAVLPLLEADRQVAIHRGGRQIVAVSRIKEVLGPADASQPSPLPRPGQPPRLTTRSDPGGHRRGHDQLALPGDRGSRPSAHDRLLHSHRLLLRRQPLAGAPGRGRDGPAPPGHPRDD